MKEFRRQAETIAREAGDIVHEGFGKVDYIEYKGDIDLVTKFDRISEKHILRRLHVLFPDHAIRAEEGGGHSSSGSGSAFEWLIDPIDGTTNFAHGLPIFGVSIALLQAGEVIAGVVYDPIRDELFSAAKSQGATLNGKQIGVSTATVLNQSVLATGFPYDLRTNPDNNLDHFSNFTLRARAIRRPGAAAIDLVWTACGRLDGLWELRLNPWDVAAGALIVREAGGHVSDLTGGDDWLDPANIVASNGKIHSEMLAVLRDGNDAPRPA